MAVESGFQWCLVIRRVVWIVGFHRTVGFVVVFLKVQQEIKRRCFYFK